MKVTGLEGDYCQSCVGPIVEAMSNKPEVLVLCSPCVSALRASGDYERVVHGHVEKLKAKTIAWNEEPSIAPKEAEEVPEKPKAKTKKRR